MSRMSELSGNLRYIAESLQLLEKIMSLPDCHNCSKLGACEYQPEWGKIMRFNCPLWESDKPKEGT